MNKQEIPGTKNAPIDVWHTVNIAVYRQLGFWYDVTRVYQFIPATSCGYVIVSPQGQEIGCEPLKGYTVFRPCGLQLSWHQEKSVVFRQLSLEDARKWETIAHILFQKIVAQRI